MAHYAMRPPPRASSTDVSAIPCLDSLSSSLERLDLSRNRIDRIDRLDALVGLRELNLARNSM